QIDGGLARSIDAHAGRAVNGDHRRDVDDCSFASLRHQRGKLGDEKIGRLHIERIDVVERLLARFVSPAERKHAGVIDQDVNMAVPSSTAFLATARALAASRRSEEMKSAFPPVARISAIVLSPRSTLRPTT